MSFQLMLAPLEGYTDSVFRSFCASRGADLTFTEMARIDALARMNKSTVERTIIPDDTPTEIQLIGQSEAHFSAYLKSFKPSNGFKGFNLNCSCPSSSFVNKGMGAALVRKVSKVNRLVSLIHDNGYPVSVKLRLGLNRKDKENLVYMNLINGVDADYFILHARTADESYGHLADFSVYKTAVSSGKRIIANGDISTAAHIEKLKDGGVSGAMIGRAAVLDPYIFMQLKGFDFVRAELPHGRHHANILRAVESKGRIFFGITN